jgi:ADP-heptose:LPS heptosyltransferase
MLRQNLFSVAVDSWEGCNNILCIRADNMGDVLMSSAAIAALKETFNSRITMLTSSMGAAVCRMIPQIDEIIVMDLPWVKLQSGSNPELLQELLVQLRSAMYDGCVVFTVYSQSSLPAALLAFISGIPKCAAYCRENPYQLISNWLPDEEPYSHIVHQVERDLNLVKFIGAQTKDPSLRLTIPGDAFDTLRSKLKDMRIPLNEKYIILHPGVSENKRKYPEHLWIETGRLLFKETGLELLLTGSGAEWEETERISSAIGIRAHNTCGSFTLEEFAALIKECVLLVSVNTGTVHLAAALKKALVVLYARTNPQHKPWMVPHQVLEYSIPKSTASNNQVIRYVNEQYYHSNRDFPSARQVVDALKALLLNSGINAYTDPGQ